MIDIMAVYVVLGQRVEAMAECWWGRRSIVAGGTWGLVEPVVAAEEWVPETARSISLPLVVCGSTYCVEEYAIDGSSISRAAIVDTGSPFLNALPTSGIVSRPTELADTDEIFAGSSGVVRWRRGRLELAVAGNALRATMVYGVPDSSLLTSPRGGLFFGLVKDRARAIRPTLLEQLGTVRALEVDLGATSGHLTLSRDPLLPRRSTDALHLVDLRRFGAPVKFYAASVSSLVINGRRVTNLDRPVVAIFDTGVTGAQLSPELADLLGPARQIGLEFRTERGRSFKIAAHRKANPRFLVTPVELPWRGRSKIHVIALGLAFLVGHVLTVDLDQDRLMLRQSPEAGGFEDAWEEPAITSA